jgi:putative N6-adenine-specific DNA methylase
LSDTPPRKKISLNPADRAPADASPRPDDGRSRSGPRARRVVQAALESGKARRLERAAEPDRGERGEGAAARDAGRPDRAERPRMADRFPERSSDRSDPASAGARSPSARPAAAGGRPGSDRPSGDRGDRGDRASGGRPGEGRSAAGRSGSANPNARERRPTFRSTESEQDLSVAAHEGDQSVGDTTSRASRPTMDAGRGAPGTQRGGFRPRNSPSRTPAAPVTAQAEAVAARAKPGVEIFPVFAPCPQGLEGVLVDELKGLGFADAWAGRAGAHFTADWTEVMRVNLQSRLATRILVQVNYGTVHTEDDLLELARATPWERWFGAEQTLRVDTSAVRSPMKSLQFCNLRAKDGICDRLRDREGERPSIDTVRPDARVHVFLSETTATLYLDTSGESLFKRGWRLDKGEAPLRENLAAGLLALSGWRIDSPLLDPFCGSGTIVIEAALKALNVPPGISRPFAFERLRGHQEWRWRDLKEDARAHILPKLPMQLAGADIDERAIAAARDNAERAGLTEDAVYFEVADARDTCPLDEQVGWIITNPPYGERLDIDTDTQLWTEWASTLKREFGGWQMHMITNDLDLPKKLRLNPSRRTPLYNGALECRLFGFELVAGGFRR